MGMEKDLRKMLLGGKFKEAVKVHGEPAVQDEIEEMTFGGLADSALAAAHFLGYYDLARTAARVITCSGSYDPEAHELAKQYPS